LSLALTGIGISYSILDNVDDVRDWYKQALIGDFSFADAARHGDWLGGQPA
jgi:hypothetical protein